VLTTSDCSAWVVHCGSCTHGYVGSFRAASVHPAGRMAPLTAQSCPTIYNISRRGVLLVGAEGGIASGSPKRDGRMRSAIRKGMSRASWTAGEPGTDKSVPLRGCSTLQSRPPLLSVFCYGGSKLGVTDAPWSENVGDGARMPAGVRGS